jgi:hypothetical protein
MEDAAVRLNFFSATNAHKAWKKRLYDCICSSCASLDPAVVALDNRCDLGRWLYSIRDSQPQLSPQTQRIFTRLLEEHSAFHRAAAKVVQQALDGQTQDALRQLQGSGDYNRISNQVIATLGELYLKRSEFGME